MSANKAEANTHKNFAEWRLMSRWSATKTEVAITPVLLVKKRVIVQAKTRQEAIATKVSGLRKSK
jgi:hypothetical protein